MTCKTEYTITSYTVRALNYGDRWVEKVFLHEDEAIEYYLKWPADHFPTLTRTEKMTKISFKRNDAEETYSNEI